MHLLAGRVRKVRTWGKQGRQRTQPGKQGRKREGKYCHKTDERPKKTKVESCRAEDKKPIEKIKRIEERTENRERHNGPTKREREREVSRREDSHTERSDYS